VEWRRGEVVEMPSTEEVYRTVIVASRSRGRLDVPNGGLTGSGVRYGKVRDGDGEARAGSDERETTAGDVRKMAVDAVSDGLGEVKRNRDKEMRQNGGSKRDIVRFQSEVVVRGGPRRLAQRVRECN
jgi:hypothetical protein